MSDGAGAVPAVEMAVLESEVKHLDERIKAREESWKRKHESMGGEVRAVQTSVSQLAQTMRGIDVRLAELDGGIKALKWVVGLAGGVVTVAIAILAIVLKR